MERPAGHAGGVGPDLPQDARSGGRGMSSPSLFVEPAADRESTAVPAGGFTGLLWLTWRQHRWALLGALVLAAALGGWLVYLAAELTSLHHQCGDTYCSPYSSQTAILHAR